jgi:hypothetical protein
MNDKGELIPREKIRTKRKVIQTIVREWSSTQTAETQLWRQVLYLPQRLL